MLAHRQQQPVGLMPWQGQLVARRRLSSKLQLRRRRLASGPAPIPLLAAHQGALPGALEQVVLDPQPPAVKADLALKHRRSQAATLKPPLSLSMTRMMTLWRKAEMRGPLLVWRPASRHSSAIPPSAAAVFLRALSILLAFEPVATLTLDTEPLAPFFPAIFYLGICFSYYSF